MTKPKEGLQPVDPNETPHEKFLRNAKRRVTQTLDELRKVGKLSGKTYEYHKPETDEIMVALLRGINQVRRSFGYKSLHDEDSPIHASKVEAVLKEQRQTHARINEAMEIATEVNLSKEMGEDALRQAISEINECLKKAMTE